MKKLLIISGGVLPVPAVKGGAVETLIDSIVKENEKTKAFEIDIVSCESNCQTNNKAANFFIIHYPWYIRLSDRVSYLYTEKIKKDWRSMFIRNRYKSLYYMRKLIECVDFHKYDVVVVENNMSLLESVYKSMEEDFSKKCFYHMHSVLVDNLAMIPYLAKCKKILTVSDYVTNELKRTVPAFQNTIIQKVINGIETSFAANSLDMRRRLRKKYNIDDDTCVFLFTGRLSIEKGAKELLEAYTKGIFHNAILMYVGSAVSGSKEVTSYVSSMRELAEHSPNRIEFTGYISHEQINGYYQMADVLVVPSVVGDAAPLTVLEGMASGIPIIAANVGGIPEYTSDYNAITYVDSGEGFVEKLGEQMMKFYENCLHKRTVPVYYDTRQFFESFCSAISN